VVFVVAIAAWLGYLVWRGRQMRAAAPEGEVSAHETASPRAEPETGDGSRPSGPVRHGLVLAVLGGGVVAMITGALLWGWTLVHFTAVLLAVGALGGVAGGLKLRGTSHAMQEGLARVAYAAVLVGVARAISVVLEHGAILDTITDALFRPLQSMAPAGTGVMTFVSQSLLAGPVPSDSGRAMLVLPILVPLSDLLHVSRQVVVLTFQYSTLASGIVMPTTGAMLAMLTLAEVPLSKWLRFILPIFLALSVISGIAIVVAVRMGLQ
jgi:uncharacterized ion transporter superfamily protein YfcC